MEVDEQRREAALKPGGRHGPHRDQQRAFTVASVFLLSRICLDTEGQSHRQADDHVFGQERQNHSVEEEALKMGTEGIIGILAQSVIT